MTDVRRRYDDPCGIARALDAVGERWGLLVIRELVFGAKRFSDLRRGLGTVSPNVLSQRLDQLEQEGIVRRRLAGPPIGTSVYELTSSGRELLPVLDGLARWGSRRPLRSDRPLSRDALMFALQTTVRDGVSVPGGLRVTLDGSSWDPEVRDGTMHWRPPTDAEPTATLQTSSTTLHRMAFRGLSAEEAMETGDAHVDGDASLVVQFLEAFERPGPPPP